MVKPSISELSKQNTYNRYMLVMMAAKGAKYVVDRENYAKEHDDNDFGLKKENEIEIDFNNKPVKNAIKLFHEDKIFIKLPKETQEAMAAHDNVSLSSTDIEQ